MACPLPSEVTDVVADQVKRTSWVRRFQLMHRKRCLCSCDLRAASIIIAAMVFVFGLYVLGLHALIVYGFAFYPESCFRIRDMQKTEIRRALCPVSMGYMIVGAFTWLASLILLIGIKKVTCRVTDVGRLTDGILADPGMFRSVVAISAPGIPECKIFAGVLISDSWVLANSVCLQRASNFQVILGSTRWDTPDAGSVAEAVTLVEIEPSRQRLGLLRLPNAVDISAPYIGNASLPETGNIYFMETVFSAGWGQVVNGSPPEESKTLLYRQSTVEDPWPCINNEYVLCAENLNPCSRDEGNPVIYKDETGREYILAFTRLDRLSDACPVLTNVGFTKMQPQELLWIELLCGVTPPRSHHS